MGAIAQLLGVAPQQAPIQTPTTAAQADQAQQQAQQGIGQQQQFVNALAGQNGIGNQQSVFGQQQALAGQLGQMAQGGGPNPALAQLAATTGQNNASTAALAAGQRGAGANAGLIARQAGMQGAQANQAAAGQAATLRAQQQLVAIQQLQQQQQMLGGLATQQVGQQAQGIQGLNSAIQGNQGQVLGGIGNQNNAQVGMQSNINQTNASLLPAISGAVGQLGGAVAAMAHGGSVPDQGASVSEHHVVAYFLGGGEVPGQARIGGDSKVNDTVPAMLSPGEIVVPRSAAQSPEKAAAFASAVARRGKR